MIQDIFDPNWIRVTYGNTASISIDLKDPVTGDDITLTGNDKVIFTVKSKRGEKVIEKVLTSDDTDPDEPTNVLCNLSSEETKLVTGEYHYDCLYVSEYGQVTTFIASIFQICEAISTLEA